MNVWGWWHWEFLKYLAARTRVSLFTIPRTALRLVVKDARNAQKSNWAPLCGYKKYGRASAPGLVILARLPSRGLSRQGTFADSGYDARFKLIRFRLLFYRNNLPFPVARQPLK